MLSDDVYIGDGAGIGPGRRALADGWLDRDRYLILPRLSAGVKKVQPISYVFQHHASDLGQVGRIGNPVHGPPRLFEMLRLLGIRGG